MDVKNRLGLSGFTQQGLSHPQARILGELVAEAGAQTSPWHRTPPRSRRTQASLLLGTPRDAEQVLRDSGDPGHSTGPSTCVVNSCSDRVCVCVYVLVALSWDSL